MSDRKREDYKLQAGLHGADIKNEKFNKPVNLSDTDKIRRMGIDVVEG